MSKRPQQSGSKLAKGVAQVFSVELLILPIGMLAAIVLTRGLGPEIYGLYVLALTLILWVENFTAFVINRSSEYFMATAEDWRPVASFIVRLHLINGLCGGALLMILAPAIGSWMGQEGLVTPLRILAMDPPIFGLAVGHRNILVGRGRYQPRAYGPLARWVCRLAVVIILLELGLGINGAALAVVAGSVAELCLYRYFTRPPLWLKRPIALKKFFRFSAPLALNATAINFFSHMDIIMLGVLLPSTQGAGLYGAALNLCLPIRALSISLVPLLNSDLSRLYVKGQADLARQRVGQTWQLAWLIFPFLGVLAGSAGELMALLYGPAFAGSAAPFRLLVFSSWGILVMNTGCAMLVARAKPGWVLAASFWLPFVAMGSCILLIPWLGILGAAMATTLTCLAGCAVMTGLVYKAWRVTMPLVLGLKSMLVCAALLFLGLAWPVPGYWVLGKLAALAALGLLALLLMRGFSQGQLTSALGLLARDKAT